MATRDPFQLLLKEPIEILKRHLWLWAVPTLGLTLLAAFYAALTPSQWRASQALVVRDEAVLGSSSVGRFDSIDMMKTFQETILEVARNRIVVQAALRDLGPPSPRDAADWPGSDDVESLQECISVDAPKGAEFGRTEVIYLSVTGRTPDQAVVRTKAVCDQLERHLAELRRARANGLIAELEKSRAFAEADLEKATAQLESLEREVGPDLGELRILNDTGAGESNLRLALNQIKSELRQMRATLEENQVLRELLQEAQSNPDELVVTPGRLLDSQPALRTLKEGLVEAQLQTARLKGRMQERHPQVVAALAAEVEIRQDLHAEIASALRGVEADLRVTRKQIESLDNQQIDLQTRLDRLAQMRARYSNLVDDVKQRTAFVQDTQQALAETRASHTGALATSLLTRFQQPEVGDSPVGPSNRLIVMTGAIGGLALGLGLVLLTVPVRPQPGRRWSDYISFGRRATDRLFGRRAADRTTSAEAAGGPEPESGTPPPTERRRQPSAV